VSDPDRVRLYLSTEHACGYLSGHGARHAYLDPAYPLDAARYGFLLSQGFRRSGVHVYRPHCLGCQQCIAVRIPVESFAPNRSQRRCAQRNADLQFRVVPRLDDSHFAVYRRYLEQRHPGGGMDGANREAFHGFLECSWNATEFWEWRDQGTPVCVAVVDRVPGALSAVYTFYEPAMTARGLGTFAVLEQVEQARDQALDYVYLGYWIEQSPKMNYKQNFRPLEQLTPRGWRPIRSALSGGR
jgi:leucyl-tRNA---protein transferase